MCFEKQNKDKAQSTFYRVVIKYSLIPLCENLEKVERQKLDIKGKIVSVYKVSFL